MTDRQSPGTNVGTVIDEQPRGRLEQRRMDMKSAEGHAGSVPRGNPEPEEQNVGQHRDEYERVLGH